MDYIHYFKYLTALNETSPLSMCDFLTGNHHIKMYIYR